MIDRSVIGTEDTPITMDIERGRLRLFAKAIGEDNPVCADVEAARAAGHQDIPVPPTFLVALTLEQPDAFEWLTSLGVDLRRVLHGEQAFTYAAPAYAGDRLTAVTRIADVYDRKGGALEFIVRETDVSRGDEPIARMTSTIVVQNPEVAS